MGCGVSLGERDERISIDTADAEKRAEAVPTCHIEDVDDGRERKRPRIPHRCTQKLEKRIDKRIENRKEKKEKRKKNPTYARFRGLGSPCC